MASWPRSRSLFRVVTSVVGLGSQKEYARSNISRVWRVSRLESPPAPILENVPHALIIVWLARFSNNAVRFQWALTSLGTSATRMEQLGLINRFLCYSISSLMNKFRSPFLSFFERTDVLWSYANASKREEQFSSGLWFINCSLSE